MNTPHLIEIALLMLAAFLIGCIIGYFLRRLIGGDAATKVSPQDTKSAPAQKTDTAAVAKTGAAEKTAAKPATKPKTAAKKPAPKRVSAAKTTASKPVAKKAATKPTASKTTASKSTAAKPAAKKPAASKGATPAKSTASKAGVSKAAGTKTTAKTTAAKAAPKSAAKKPATKPAAAADGKPEALSAPRGGAKDDLKNIKGVGPKIEGILNGMGIYHFDQVASWSRKEVKWVDEELSFKGRIDREKWIAQAKVLVKGK